MIPSVTRMPRMPSVREELAAHSDALRGLARDLVGRAHADDLVQDTAVRALRSPPPRPAGMLGWLATVMRNLAANQRRTERRRARREAAAAGEPQQPAAAEAAHHDTIRAVTDALWRLPEPYQRTLVARYFGDESPAAIAARTATPLATVKSRLQRGLELLRQALAARDGREWRLALVPAFGIGGGASSLSLASVFAMTTLGKSVWLGTVAAAAVLAWWMLETGGDGPLPPANAIATAAAPAVAVAHARPDAVVRDAVPGAAGAAQRGEAAAFAFELRARVVDAEGVPVGGVHLALAPLACALALSAAPTDADGRIVVTWRARVPALTMAVGTACQGVHTALQHVAVTAGAPVELRFVAGAAPLPVGLRLDEHGRQVLDLPDCMRQNRDCRSCHDGLPSARLFEVRGSMRAGLHRDAVFGDRLAVAPPSPRLHAVDVQHAIDLQYGTRTNGIHAPTSSGGTSVLHRTQRAISGRVCGVDGRPIAGVLVECRRPNGGAFRTRTRADGTWWFRAPLPGEGPLTVRAGGGPEGLATRDLGVLDDRSIVLDLVLDRGSTLRGRAIGVDGEPLNGARVEYLALPGHDGDLAAVGVDGTFAFANLPPGPGRLLLWGARGEKLPVAEEASVLPDGGEVVFDLRARPPANGALRVDVRLHDGEPATDVEVRVWQQQTRRGAFLERLADGAFHTHGLAPGFYRVEIGALASGWRELGAYWIDGVVPTDLGTVSLAAPALLRVDSAVDLDGFELCALRADVAVRADAIAPWTREVGLPAGRWLALWRRGGVVVARELELTAGGDAVLRARE